MYKVICLVGAIPGGKNLDRLPCLGTHPLFFTGNSPISPYGLQLCVLNETRAWLLLFFFFVF